MKKKCYFRIFSIICSLVIIVSLIPIISLAQTTHDVNGYVTDEEGNGIANINVKIANLTNEYTVQTDGRGFYQINDIPKGKYNLTFDYDNVKNLYNTNDIISKEYEEYNGKLEIVFIYNPNEKTQSDIEEIKRKIDDIVSSNYRSFESTYNSEEELKQCIKELEKDSSNEKSFHKIGMRNWRNIAVVLGDITKEEVEDYFASCVTTNTGLYEFFVQDENQVNDYIFGEIYKKLTNKTTSEPNVISIYDQLNSEDGKAVTKEMIIDKEKNINCIFFKEEQEEEVNTISFDTNYANFIEGYVLKKDGSPIKDNVKIYLLNTNDETKRATTYPNDDGKYEFAYPEPGKYKIEFVFRDSQINGQYYNVITDYVDINACTDISKNVVLGTNINEIKDYFSVIEKEKEKYELDNQTGECTLRGLTDRFEVEVSYGTDTDGDGVNDTTIYPTSKKYGTIILEEREKFSLTIEEKINNLTLTLSNGEKLINWNREENLGEKVENLIAIYDPTNNYKNMQIIITDELRHGSTLNIEYKITVTNNSRIDCEGFTLLSNCQGFEYSDKLINKTIPESNKNIGWKKIDLDEAKSLCDNNQMPENGWIKYETNEQLKAGESKEIYLSFSIFISNQDDFEYYNRTEVVQYKNLEGRRNYDANGNIIKAGNFDYSNSEYERQEADDDFSGAVAIIPPFGIR